MEIRKIGTVKTLQEFMEAVWKEPQHLDEGRLIFRGQTDDWPLLPKLFRSNRTAGELSQLEHVLFQQFRERCLYLLPSLPDNPYNQMSLAQHHGLPTRLLDWTSNPLMALFFAVESNSPPTPIVFVYHASQDQLDRGKMLTAYPGPSMPGHKGTVVLSPTSHSQRVVAQAGWHTSHSLDGLDEHSLCNVAMNDSEEDSKRLATIEIDWPEAGAIRQELRAMGIHAATVYGDLTSICSEIQNDLHVSPGMRRDVQHWKKRQDRAEAHLLALMLLNGRQFQVGEPFSWFYEPDGVHTSGGKSAISSELLEKAMKLAKLYGLIGFKE